MSTTLTIVLVVVLVVLVALVVWGALRAARTRRLRTRFGPEYERAVANAPSRNRAENDLRDRERRHEELELRPLDPATRDRYAREWASVQERFVDAPARSTREADRLVTDLMRERGYPVENFGQQVADLSVRHGRTIDHYRRAHAISTHISDDQAETEDMRQAMVHYRELFADLLRDDVRDTSGTPGTPGSGASADPAAARTGHGAHAGDGRSRPATAGAGAKLRNLLRPARTEPPAGHRGDRR